jgi:hypothetical protein
MAVGRVPRRRDDLHGTVAEDVAIAHELLDLLCRREDGLGGPGHRPVVFRGLDQHGRRREQHDVADVIAMGMRYGEIGDVGRLDADLFELRRQGLGAAVGDGAVGELVDVGSARPRARRSGVPQQLALVVSDQVAVAENSSPALVDARRPRDWSAMCSAVEHVQLLDAGARRADPDADHAGHRHDERSQCFAGHECSSLVLRLYRADLRRTILGMARSLHRPLCAALFALTLLGPPVGAQPVGAPAVVEHLLRDSRRRIVRRWQAIESTPIARSEESSTTKSP